MFYYLQSTAPGYELITLEKKAQDRDFNPTTKEIQMFSLDRLTKPDDDDSYVCIFQELGILVFFYLNAKQVIQMATELKK